MIFIAIYPGAEQYVLPLCVSGGIKGSSGVGGGGFGGIDTGGLKDPSAPGREDFGDELNELLCDDLTGWQNAIRMIHKGRHIGVDVPPFMRFVRMCLRTGMLVEYRHSARNIMR